MIRAYTTIITNKEGAALILLYMPYSYKVKIKTYFQIPFVFNPYAKRHRVADLKTMITRGTCFRWEIYLPLHFILILDHLGLATFLVFTYDAIHYICVCVVCVCMDVYRYMNLLSLYGHIW